MKQAKNRVNLRGTVNNKGKISGALKMKQFKYLAIGATFYCGGNTCTKKSTRTAWIDKGLTLWFYFGQDEYVKPLKRARITF